MMIVAEIGASHCGSLARALNTIDAAVDAGADAVKFQTWTHDRMAIPGEILDHGPWKGRELTDIYREAYTPWEWFPTLFDHAKRRGIVMFSTPFDIASVDYLEQFNCPMYKIASYELVDLRLIERVARTGKPMIMSTGQATRNEIGRAVKAAYFENITLLHCVSSYPASLKEMELYQMRWLGDRHQCKFGLSDHTLGIAAAVAATALGASMIEKHISLSMDGLDGVFAATPTEFEAMVDLCRQVEKAGRVNPYRPDQDFSLRRSLYYDRDMKAGMVLKEGDMKTARPNLGLCPTEIESAIGHKLGRDVKENEPVKI